MLALLLLAAQSLKPPIKSELAPTSPSLARIQAQVRSPCLSFSVSILIYPGLELTGFGLLIKKKNVIVRNLSISKVLADNGDAIGLQTGAATNIWIDHVDLSSDMDHDKDYYDGLLDITHAADYVTVSNTKFHDHFKTSLVGHSDNNAAEDTGHLRVTYANNYWTKYVFFFLFFSPLIYLPLRPPIPLPPPSNFASCPYLLLHELIQQSTSH